MDSKLSIILIPEKLNIHTCELEIHQTVVQNAVFNAL